MPQVQALLFDLGNVCVRLRTQAFLDAVTPLGWPGLKPSEVLESLRVPDAPYIQFEYGRLDSLGFYRAQADRLGLRVPYEEWLRLWNAYFEPNRPMEALIARLRGQAKLWALTNTNADHLAHVKLNFRFMDAFDGVTASNECGARKPEPAIFEHARAALGLPAGQILYLDDVEDFVKAGRALGFKAFHYTFNDKELQAELKRLGFELGSLEGRSPMAC